MGSLFEWITDWIKEGLIDAITGQYTSIFPLEAHDDWLHNAAQIKRLAKLAERVSELEKKLESMEKTS